MAERDILYKIANTAVRAAVIANILACTPSSSPKEEKLQPDLIVTLTPKPPTPELTSIITRPDLKRLFEEDKNLTSEIIVKSHLIMDIEPPLRGERNRRTVLEENLFAYLEENNASSADILSGMKFAGTIDGRAWGSELLWKKRQSGQLKEYGINPLDENRIKWAIDNDIDPRILAISIDAVGPTLDLLKAAPDLFFEAVKPQDRYKINFEDSVPNPGAFSKLNMTETGYQSSNSTNPINENWGYVFIGGSTAWNEINVNNPDAFPSGHEDLIWIAQSLESTSGIPYAKYVDKIPGSEWGNRLFNISGGAIGPQFMPLNARLFMQWYTEANNRLGNKYPEVNLFEPYTGTILSYLYLASEWYGRHGDVDSKTIYVRPGYKASNSELEKIESFQKWNPTWQAGVALLAGYSYYNKFGRV
jgi:hypothetical protein